MAALSAARRRIGGAVGHQSGAREFGDHPVAFGHAIHRLGDHLADHRRGEVPLLEDGADRVLVSPTRDHQHPLLRLTEQNLIRRHIGLADRHLGDVDRDADVAAGRHLGRRRREAGRAHVLNGHDVAAGDQLEACLEQQLLGERIADLHARALGLGGRRQVLRRERGAVDAVAAGAGADGDDRIADALGHRAHQFRFLVHQPDAHGVDQRVAVVRRVEHDLAGHGRHAHAVAVVADALHDAGEQVADARRIEAAEAERVEHRDGPGAHGEDIAQNAADARGGALIRLHGRRVVVRLDLERDRRGRRRWRSRPRSRRGPAAHSRPWWAACGAGDASACTSSARSTARSRCRVR